MVPKSKERVRCEALLIKAFHDVVVATNQADIYRRSSINKGRIKKHHIQVTTTGEGYTITFSILAWNFVAAVLKSHGSWITDHIVLIRTNQ